MFSDSDSGEMLRKCAVCTRDSRQSCSACRSVAYCSVEHQKKHWKVHKKSCSYFHVKDDPELGKGLVASRDIKAGTLIWEALPFLMFPASDAAPSCVACGCIFSCQRRPQPCVKCTWPVCSLECAKLPIHASNECSLFATKGFTYPPPFETETGILPIFLRLVRSCYLKQKHPKDYHTAFELYSGYDIPEVNDDKDKWLELMKPHFINLDLHMGIEEWNKHWRILMNYANTSVDHNRENKWCATNPYIKPSRMNHSCISNCRWSLSDAPEYIKREYTTMAVRKGEALTCSYYPNQVMYATKFRQEKFVKTGFQCKCARCIDPTELGTYASAIVCKSCKPKKSESIGYFLPENPLDLSADATWKCNNCGTIKVASAILAPVEALAKFVAKDLDASKISDGKTLMKKCKKFVKKYSGKSLHPNHWVIQNAMRAVIDYYSGGPGSVQDRVDSMDSEMCQYFVKCGQHLLAFLDVVTPGVTLARAQVQLWVSYALCVQNTLFMDQRRYLEALGISKQLLDIQREALKFYELEFPNKNCRENPADALRNNIRCATDDELFLKILVQIDSMAV